jgi:hypothetical protein
MESKDLKVGDRIKVHPASDWFMRGVRYATISRIRPSSVEAKTDAGKTINLRLSSVQEVVHV